MNYFDEILRLVRNLTQQGQMDTTLVLLSRWIGALLSGTYTQGIGRLQNTDGSMCCLGVLCDVQNPNGWLTMQGENVWNMPALDMNAPAGVHGLDLSYRSDYEKFGITRDLHSTLTGLNDSGRVTFKEIADLIQLYRELLQLLAERESQKATGQSERTEWQDGLLMSYIFSFATQQTLLYNKAKMGDTATIHVSLAPRI